MRLTFAPLIAFAAVAAGCGSSETKSSDPPAASEQPPARTETIAAAKQAARPSGPPALATHSSQYGRILTDGRGRTLYVFTRETNARSRCYGACARAWPPLYAKRRNPRVTGGARQRLIGTTRRRDGRRQVTYAGHPVYYYVGESMAGQVLCQNVTEYGGTWLVADSSGRAIR